jgi:hypothetical protein
MRSLRSAVRALGRKLEAPEDTADRPYTVLDAMIESGEVPRPVAYKPGRWTPELERTIAEAEAAVRAASDLPSILS